MSWNDGSKHPFTQLYWYYLLIYRYLSLPLSQDNEIVLLFLHSARTTVRAVEMVHSGLCLFARAAPGSVPHPQSHALQLQEELPSEMESSCIAVSASYQCFTVHNGASTLAFQFKPKVSYWIQPSCCPHLLFCLFPFTIFCFTLLSSPDLFWVKLNWDLCSKCSSAADGCLLHGTRPKVVWSKGTMIWLLCPQQLFYSTDPLLLVLITCSCRNLLNVLLCFWQWGRWLCT